MTSRQSIEIAAEPDTLFALTQNYQTRLDWDPFLKEARLVNGAKEAGLGVRARCTAWNGYAMETEYVSFNPPEVCAVEMTEGPWFFRSFAGSWRFEPLGPGRTAVSFTYHIVARPRFLTGILANAFGRDTSRRLEALKRAVEFRSMA
jgi:ribosome-associated toxin RatA of RatAB toxin-antitoxin module